MGDSMTAISLGQSVQRSRLSKMALTAAVNGRLTNDRGGYSVGSAQVEQFDLHNVTALSKEFAGGFVDLLLGRGVRHSR